MRTFLLLGIAFFASIALAKPTSLAQGLPEHYDTRKLSLPAISEGTTPELSCMVTIPSRQELNHQAPSAVDVYEEISNGKWEKLASFDLVKQRTAFGQMQFQTSLKLKSPTSRLAIDSTLYHCSPDHSGPCVIESFQGLVSRAKGASSAISVKIAGSMPKYAK